MEELGTMSKNNLSGITLVRGPIWGIRSLTLIIFWVGQIITTVVTAMAIESLRAACSI